MGGDAAGYAARLIAEFGSVAEVLAAAPEGVDRVLPNSPAAEHLATLRQVLLHTLETDVFDRPVLAGGEALARYLRSALGTARIEECRVLFLDTGHALVREEVMSRGTADEVAVYPREIARRALELGATGIILVHNHPSGNAEPSGEDVVMTRRVTEACGTLGIRLHDHLIVTRRHLASLRGLRPALFEMEKHSGS